VLRERVRAAVGGGLEEGSPAVPTPAVRAYTAAIKVSGAVGPYMSVLREAALGLSSMCNSGDRQACTAKALLEMALYESPSEAVLFEDSSYRVVLRQSTAYTAYLEVFERYRGQWVRVASLDMGDPSGSAKQLLGRGDLARLAAALEDSSMGRAATWAENLVREVYRKLVRMSPERGRAADLAAAALEDAYASILEKSIASRC